MKEDEVFMTQSKNSYLDMNKSGLYVFYGTLRVGMENHSLYAHGMKYLKTVDLKGFKLFSLGDYPYAVKSFDNQLLMKAELFKMENSEVEKSIHNMEIEAGYYYENIQIENQQYGIYLFEKASQHDVEITSGDWVKFVS